MPDASINTPLPASGDGYKTYNREDGGRDQYGTLKTIAAIVTLGLVWHRQRPFFPFAVGDVSRRGGGPFPPHKSHRTGRDVDFRPLRKDGQNLPCTWRDALYSRDLTGELCKLIRQQHPTALIFFNDPALVKGWFCSPLAGHDNHLHVRFPA